MASGDRIELLTAGTFETAMNTVAKEDSVANVQAIVNAINTNLTTTKTNVDTANTNINIIKTSVGTASTVPSVTSAGGVVNTANTIQQKLQGLSQYQIGATNSTGGSATAGNVMAKLNAILTGISSLASSSGSGLASTLFVPSDTVLKSFIGSTPYTPIRNCYIGSFAAKYTGTLKINTTFFCAQSSSNYGSSISVFVNPTCPMDQAVYPTMQMGQTISPQWTGGELSTAVTLLSPTSTTVSLYPRVKAGDMIYICAYGSDKNLCTITKCDICGSTITSF